MLEVDPWRLTSPFQDYTQKLGQYGVGLLDYLCIERPDADDPDWQQRDSLGWDQWMSLEHTLQDLSLPAELDAERQLRPFHERVHRFHTALPYTEAERGWLMTANGCTGGTLEEMPGKLYDQEECIVAAGLLRVVNGRDLTRRWISWRRETDEYTGQDMVDYTRELLRDVIQLGTPDLPLPECY